MGKQMMGTRKYVSVMVRFALANEHQILDCVG